MVFGHGADLLSFGGQSRCGFLETLIRHEGGLPSLLGPDFNLVTHARKHYFLG